MKPFIRYLLIAKLSATSAFDGGLFYVISGYILKLIRLVVLLFVWRSLLGGETGNTGMKLESILTYTFLSSILSEQLTVVTPASTAFWEGSLASRYTRPMAVLLQLMAETMGRWLPSLLLYSLPMLCLAPFIGVNILPESFENCLWSIPSFILAVSLGFALDFLFAAIVIYLKNASYTAFVIRKAITTIFSGALIPFAFFPWGIGDFLRFLPFGSTAGAPLTIYTSGQDVRTLLIVQLLWNLTIWSITLKLFQKSQERLVSYGG